MSSNDSPGTPPPPPGPNNNPQPSVGSNVTPAKKVCPGCRTENPADASYCYRCGSKLPEKMVSDRKACPGCRAVNTLTSQYCYKCGLKLTDQPVPIAATIGVYAGFWRRMAAYLLDILLLGIATAVIQALVAPGTFAVDMDLVFLSSPSYWTALLISAGIEMAYFTVATGRWGRTFGKLLMGIKVVRVDGSKVTYWRAFGRFWGYSLCWLTWGIGFIVIAFNGQKRGLHDLVCDTVVIKA